MVNMKFVTVEVDRLWSSYPATCPVTIFVILPCPALPCRALNQSDGSDSEFDLDSDDDDEKDSM